MEADFPSPESLLSAIALALRASDVNRAGALAEHAFKHGIRHPLVFTARGAWLAQRQRHAEALAAFSQAEALSAPTAATRSAVGVTLAELRRFDEAIAAFKEAIDLSPDSPHLYVRLAWAHELAGNLLEARSGLNSALRLEPENAAALGRLAFVEVRSGAWEQARRIGTAALSQDSNEVKAHLAVAMAETELGSVDEAEQRLNKLLAMDHLGTTDRYFALSLLGDIRDRQNRIDNAMQLYDRANAVRREARHPSAPSMMNAVDGLLRYMETVQPRPPVRWTGRENGVVAGHVFLLGFLRSGTTLIQQILAAHPHVSCLEERDTLGEATRSFLSKPSDLEKLWNASPAELARHREIYWKKVREFGGAPDGRVFVDKVPINAVKLPLISRLFPQATILFAVRDPRDVVLSCYRRRLGANPTTDEFYSIENTARFYDAVMRLAQAYCTKLSIPLHHIRHESLVAHFDNEVRKICALIGLTWDDRMRRFAKTPELAAVATPSAMQLAKGLNSEGIGQWRRYRSHLEPVLPLLAFWVKKFNYATDSRHRQSVDDVPPIGP